MKITLFFTRKMSLKYWVDSGLFEREKLIYEQHLQENNLQEVFWLTYGDKDSEIADKLKLSGDLHKNITVVSMPKVFTYIFKGDWLYSIVMPFINKKIITDSDILKTNQIDGSWSAVIAKLLYKKVLMIRTGYTLSQLANKNEMFSYLKRKIIESIERFAYNYADISVVSSQHNKRYLLAKYGLVNESMKVQYNFIDTEIFKKTANVDQIERLLYVGRLSKEKNLFALLEACKKCNFGLDLYGKGPLQEELSTYVNTHGIDVNFKGLVPNKELVKVYNKYKYYILTSYQEGMPKTLLEAMACGCVCIGTNVEGINEVLDETRGYLAMGTEASSIAVAIEKAQSDVGQVEKQNKAVEFVVNNCSIERYIQVEKDIFGEWIK